MTETKTLIEALRILARDIQSEDGVANAAIAEAADRLEELAKDKRRVDGFVNWLDAEIKKMMYVSSTLNVYQKVQALREAKKQLEKLRNGLGEKSRCELCDGYGGLAIKGPPNPYSSVVPCPRCNP